MSGKVGDNSTVERDERKAALSLSAGPALGLNVQ